MELEKSVEICSLLDVYGELLSLNQLSIMKDYYYFDNTLSEIATNNQITRQAVLDIIKKSTAKLEIFELKLNLLKKKSDLKQTIDDFKGGRILKNEFVDKIEKMTSEI